MKFGPGLAAAALALALTPSARAQITAPIKITLAYDGRLNALHLPGSLKVLELHIAEHAAPADFTIDGTVKSYGLLRAFKLIDVRSVARGPVEKGMPQPSTFDYVSVDKDRTRRVSMTWTPDAVIVMPDQGDGGAVPPTPAQKLAAVDPLTLLARAAYAPSGDSLCKRSWPSYDGRELYELQVHDGEPAPLSDKYRAMGFTQAVRCAVRYVEIAGFKHKPGDKPGGGLKTVIHTEFGQYGANGPWTVLSMKADTILGYAQVEPQRGAYHCAR